MSVLPTQEIGGSPVVASYPKGGQGVALGPTGRVPALLTASDVIDDFTVVGAVLASYDTNSRFVGNLPTAYKDLVLVVVGKATVTGDLNVNVNSSAATYYSQRLTGIAAAAGAQERLNTTVFEAAASFGPAAGLGNHAVIEFLNYNDTTFQKALASEWFTSTNTGTGTLISGKTRGAWNNTAAITRIAATINGSTFVIGTRFTLYGRG